MEDWKKVLKKSGKKLYSVAKDKCESDECAMRMLYAAVKKTSPIFEKLSNKDQYISIVVKELGSDCPIESKNAEVPLYFEGILEMAFMEGLEKARKNNVIIILSGVIFVLLTLAIVMICCYFFNSSLPHHHTYIESIIEPGCVSDGYRLHRCKCGYEYKTDVIDATGHMWSLWEETIAPSMEEEGMESRSCTMCQIRITRKVPTLAIDHMHSYDKITVIKESTCIEEGLEHLCCSYVGCEAYKEQTIDKKAHTYGEWETTLHPDEDSFGEKKRFCTECGKAQIETIPSLNATNITIPGSKTYKNGTVTLSNVHSINDSIGFNGDHGFQTNGHDSTCTISSTTAPNGTVYLLSVSRTDTETCTDTVSLYEMKHTGWAKLHDYNVKYNVQKGAKKYSKFFVFCDEESNVFSFLFSSDNNKFNAYKYEPSTGRTLLVDSLSISMSTLGLVATSNTRKAYFVGSNGSANGNVEYIAFDYSQMKFSVEKEQYNKSVIAADIQYKNEMIYFLAIEYSPTQGTRDLVLYCIKDYADKNYELKYACKLASGPDYDTLVNENESNILVDDLGCAYVFYNCRVMRKNSQWYALDVIDCNGEKIASNKYESFHQPGFKYSPRNGGAFWGNDGYIYFIEYYDSLSTDFSIGKLTGKKFENATEVAVFSGLDMYAPLPIYTTNATDSVDVIYRQFDITNNVVKHGYMRISIQ